MNFAGFSLIIFMVFGAALGDGVENCPNIIERAYWSAQPPAGVLSNVTLPLPFVIILHTASSPCVTQSECTLRVRIIQTYHIESLGFDDIGYSFLIGGDGNVYKGRGWDKSGAFALGWNTKSLGIAFIGTYIDVEPSQRMMSVARSLIECGKARGFLKGDVKVLGHRQVSRTLSPGDKLYTLITQWPEWQSSV